MSNALRANLNYVAPMAVRPRYHANDISRDVIELDPKMMEIRDARGGGAGLDREGFTLVPHVSRVADFRDPEATKSLYAPEIEALVQELSGADRVRVTSPGVLRFGERSADCGRLNNSRPARFVHVDVNDATAAAFAARAAPAEWGVVLRFAHFNVWRVLSEPPQDVPLTVCEARSVAPGDLIEADAIFDEPGKPEWSFTGLVLRANARHHWWWFSDMRLSEALVFKTHDSDPAAPHCVPHTAFDNPLCPAGVPPRSSIEMRAIAYWFE